MKQKVFFFLIFSFLCLAPGLANEIRIITIDGYIISPVIQEYIEDNLREAEKNKEKALVIRLNTPGGLLQPTQDIVRSILNAEIPVITYVWPKGARAASAGAFIGYASSVLAMSPATHIGAAHPVTGDGSWGEPSDTIQKKLLNDTLAWAESIAQTRQRPYQPLYDMIKESKSFTEEEALKKGFADVSAVSLESLFEQIEQTNILSGDVFSYSKNTDLKFVELTPRQNFLNILMSPNLIYLLFTLGMLGLIFEVTNPGFGFPGIAGIICLVISFYAFSVLPVNYAGIILIVLGVIFLIVEAFSPSFGIFGSAGLAAFILGSLFMFRGPAEFKVGLSFVLPLAVGVGIWNIFILNKIIRARISKPETGKEGLIGKTGSAYTAINKTGKVFVHGELWNAQSSQKIKKGDAVEIVAIQGLKLTVKKKEV